jgi:amino acid adenylation domain-containing protein
VSMGVRPDERVAICVERSVAMVVGLLGILKAGGAYVPLDPSYPLERLAYMLRDSAPVALLTQSTLKETVGTILDPLGLKLPVLFLDETGEHSPFAGQPEHNLDPAALGLTSRHLAYVIYTSGSTGLPKGVMIEHHSVTNLVLTHVNTHNIRHTDRILQFASYAFDTSVEEIFSALSVRATIVMRPAFLLAPDETFITFLDVNYITVLDLPTAFWHQWTYELQSKKHLRCDALRLVLTGGEKAERRQLIKWFAGTNNPSCLWINTYGPTETTVYCTTIASSIQTFIPSKEIPIGRPIANTQVYIVDKNLEPVPVGVTGELYIGGDGVARGYMNRPELTAERFIADPFSGKAGARLYKTGDLGRWLGDGNIEYLGRNDFQVKVRGYRIELGEIEARLRECAGVKEAVVVAREDEAGDKRLVAYVVAEERVEVSAAELRNQLSNLLPEHMVPSAFMSLAGMPLTPNGKLDRKGLPAPDQSAVVTRGYEAPVGEVETALAEIWQELLGLERVGRHDHFFELGGHSLLCVKLFSAINQRFDLLLPLSTIFTAPSLDALALIVQTRYYSQSILVPLHLEGKGRPLFCIHPVGGQVFFYNKLAQYLGNGYPIYGVQSPEVAGVPLPCATIEAMASTYCRAIIAAQPIGPYRLIGWSTGGIIAVAIAKALYDCGCEVEYLGLVDSTPSEEKFEKTEQSMLLATITMLATIRGTAFTCEESRHIISALSTNDISIENLLDPQKQQAITALLRKWIDADFAAEMLEPLALQLRITHHHITMLSMFVPQKVPIGLHVIWSAEFAVRGRLDDPFSVTWANTIGNPAHNRIDWVDGNHYSMLHEPHVRALAKTIGLQLNELTNKGHIADRPGGQG